MTRSRTASVVRSLSIGGGVAASAYLVYAAVAWFRYGHPSRGKSGNEDALLDRFMPAYDVVERHCIRISAPAEVTYAAACAADPQQSRVVRGIFRAREVILGSKRGQTLPPTGLLAWTKSLGWVVLEELPGRELVMGAVTQPWEANVVFRGLGSDAFVAFNEPGYVKIAWTLRADPVSPCESVFRTETRAVATDASARRMFRRYWCLLSPGIILIRWMMLNAVKSAAERHALRSTVPG